MKAVIAIVFILFSTNASAIETLKTIPSDFQGNWSPRLEECGLHPLTNGVYPSLMTITKEGISHYESGGNAASIVRRHKNEIAMILEYSGEGDLWLTYKYFILSEDKKTLTDASNPRKKYITHRCKNA